MRCIEIAKPGGPEVLVPAERPSPVPKAHEILVKVADAGVNRPDILQRMGRYAVPPDASAEHKNGPVTIVAVGPRTSTFSLVAAGLEEKAIGTLDLRGALGSLKIVIEQDWTVDLKPELFCFGLLAAFDIKQLTALVAPRTVLTK